MFKMKPLKKWLKFSKGALKLLRKKEKDKNGKV